MPTATLGPHQDVATRTDTSIAAGAGDHLPVGDYGSADYRSAIRFSSPSWGAWTAITRATLKVYISDFQHVGPKNSSIFCSRMNVPVWTKDQGTQDCESGFAGGNTTQAADIASVSGSRITFSSGSTANAAKSLDVTGMVQYYKANGAPYCVFVFDNNGADQYTELWSLGKAGTTYDAVLTIDYETSSVPNPPTLSAPAAGAVVGSAQPTFSWVHSDAQGDPQTDAQVNIYDSTGVTLVQSFHPASGSLQTGSPATPLTRGLTYQWAVQTQDATGWGQFSAKQSFTVRTTPVVTISSVRKMVFANGQPRLLVEWTCDQPQSSYQVTSSPYDSTKKDGTDQNHVLVGLPLVSGTAVTVTVTVWNTDGTPLSGSASRSFTPRYGLSSHKKTLAAVPVNMQAAAVSSVVPLDPVNGDCQLVIEYGMAATAAATTPTGGVWVSSTTNLPKPYTQYLHWRAWFIPNNVIGPTLNSIDIPYDSTVAVLDKWGLNAVWPWEANGGLPSLFSIDTGEAVYGTRSLRCDPDGATTRTIFSTKVKVREGRSYTLSGLMRSLGNTGMYFRLQDGTNTYVSSPAVTTPTVLTDWKRYKAPVWVADGDKDVWVACVVSGATAGTTAWWDGIKLEESLIATPWNPASVGATTVDAGGVQIDATKGGLFRYRAGVGARAVVEGGPTGLLFAGDTELTSPSTGLVSVNGTPLSSSTHIHHAVMFGGAFPSGPTVGDPFFRTDHKAWYVWDGVNWVDTLTLANANGLRMQRGALTMNVASGNGVVQATVTFPVAFSSGPVVGGWANASAGNAAYLTFQSISASSMDVGLKAVTAFNYTVSWWAWGPR